MFTVSETHFAATWLLDPRFAEQAAAIQKMQKSEKEPETVSAFSVSEESLVEIRHLTHIFDNGRHHQIKAVDDVSFTMKKGEIFGLVGESGSGEIYSGKVSDEYLSAVRRGNLF